MYYKFRVLLLESAGPEFERAMALPNFDATCGGRGGPVIAKLQPQACFMFSTPGHASRRVCCQH